MATSTSPAQRAQDTIVAAPRAQPLLRPGTRFGIYPQRELAREDRLERWLTRLLMPLHPPRAARRRCWPAFLQAVGHFGQGLGALDEAGLDRWIRDARRRVWREHLTRENVARAFATVREVASRELGMRPYDEQLIGGWILLEGMAAEMATGEGKTLTATLPACAAALAGIPVHVVTVNEYLVERDARLMAPVYRRFGLSVGAVTAAMTAPQRRAAYAADVTYCTNKQLVFDYLRDRLVLGGRCDDLRLRLDGLCGERRRRDELLLRGLYFAIVDEADSVFVDEARTPLILAGGAADPEAAEHYRRALWLAGQLAPGTDFAIEPHARRAALSARGAKRLGEIAAPLGGLWAGERRREMFVRQALAARELYRRDRDYLVRDGRIEIIDEHTGRTMPDRSWEQGLHQMLEAKEGLAPTARHETLARISYQRFFQRYLRLAGMSGTLKEVRGELRNVYGLGVVTVPRHRPGRLRRSAARCFRRGADKWQAIARSVSAGRAAGRPVLVGTRTLADSERLSALLDGAGVPHQVLNARQDAEEAAVVARAGEPGQVTVATNMAGRGTDIALAPGVAERGGLHVIVCEPNDARRIDRQLIGRCARQGDPGSYELFVSLEDELFSGRFRGALARLSRRGPAEVRPWFGRALTRVAQGLIEYRHRLTRRALLRVDETRDEFMGFAGRAE